MFFFKYTGFALLCLVIISLLGVSAAGFHIPTVSEGLLDNEGCYIGAYLGGNHGVNNKWCVNYYKNDTPNPYETQILDHPDDYGESESRGLVSIDTGIDTFRAGIDAIKPGSGKKQVLFSRYYNLLNYPDNDYGKIQYVPCPAPDVWMEKVLKQGGVPVLILYPWCLMKNGQLDMGATNARSMTGTDIMTDISRKCDALSKQYADPQGNPATILICFGLEFNCHDETKQNSDDKVDDLKKQAWRRMYREAYRIVHNTANPSVQMVWAGNVAGGSDERRYYWPGTDDSGNQMGDDYVDWVGMTWYPYDGGPKSLDDLSVFYSYYAKGHRHPMIFMETSADGKGDTTRELQLKTDHVTYLYSEETLKKYQNIKGIIWFNVIKGEDGMTKNFLLPDGRWDNHNQNSDKPGTLYSESNPVHMMNELYPEAVAKPYFTGPASFILSADFDMAIHTGLMAVTCTDASSGVGISSWSWDVNGDQKAEYHTRNITHRYRYPGTYAITLTVSDGLQTHTHTDTCIIPSVKPTKNSIISIGSLPEGAEIWVDDSLRIGRTISLPISFPVPSGTHTLTLKKYGYEEWRGSYSLRWPQTAYFNTIRLIPVQGTGTGDKNK